MDTIPQDTPQKQCTKCKDWFDATADFFYRDKAGKDGLRAQCKECQDASKKITYVPLTCAACSKNFNRRKSNHIARINKHGIQPTYCSQDCSNKSRSIQWPDTIGNEYLAGATTIDLAKKYHATSKAVWDHLQRIGIQTRPGGRKPKKTYNAPLNPRQVWSKTATGHTKEAKQRISQYALLRYSDPKERERLQQQAYKQMHEGTILMSSKLEDRVALELSKRGYIFGRQIGIRDPNTRRFFACADFMLINGTIIEINGTYWHADPRKYPNGPIYDTQKKKIESDKRKRQKFAELHIPLIELWEMDLEADMIGTLDKALQ